MNKKKIVSAIIIVIIVLIALFSGYRLIEYMRIQNSPPVGTTIEPPKMDHKPAPSTAPDKSEEDNSKKLDGDKNEETNIVNSDDPNRERSLRGRVIDLSSSTMIFKDDETGNELNFDYIGVEISGEFVSDVKAEIFYTGIIEGTDTTDAYLTKIATFPG